MPNPKLFVSYSWTNSDHEEWVIKLSTDLRTQGVDVILDKWDLREGHDAHVFMEKMVTDPDIKKVIIVCDKLYVEKTDGRSGGVGTEAQIISGEIYEKQSQEKFVAIVVERDEAGNAYLPVYYRSRIYIDMSSNDRLTEGFEKLLRWIYDKPLHKKPDIGEMPAYLTQDDDTPKLTTSYLFNRAVDALRNNRENSLQATKEYLTLLAKQLENFRITSTGNTFDDDIVKNIESFLPYRNEAIQILRTLAMYKDSEETRILLHRFFEQLLSYLHPNFEIRQGGKWDLDNYKFIVHELFLYAIAILIREECFLSATSLITIDYYLPSRADEGSDPMVPFTEFYEPTRSLTHRNERLKMNRLDIRSDLLNKRNKGTDINYADIMQADFILFIRDHVDRPTERWHWWPVTLLYLDSYQKPFELFARSSSSNFFDRVKTLIGIDSKDELVPLLNDFVSNKRELPAWQGRSFNPVVLLNFNNIATKL